MHEREGGYQRAVISGEGLSCVASLPCLGVQSSCGGQSSSPYLPLSGVAALQINCPSDVLSLTTINLSTPRLQIAVMSVLATRQITLSHLAATQDIPCRNCHRRLPERSIDWSAMSGSLPAQSRVFLPLSLRWTTAQLDRCRAQFSGQQATSRSACHMCGLNG